MVISIFLSIHSIGSLPLVKVIAVFAWVHFNDKMEGCQQRPVLGHEINRKSKEIEEKQRGDHPPPKHALRSLR